MAFNHLRLDELARHIGMDAREVLRLAERGGLPGHKVGGEWRFNRAELLDWLQREMHSLSPRDLHNLERAMSDASDQELVCRNLSPAAIDLALPARSRTSVLRELVVLAERTGQVYDPIGLRDALAEREALVSTALRGGIAFPHPRRPLPYATAEPLVAVGRVQAGIPFGAPDGATTDLFILVCSHDDRQHLAVLARLARMFSTDLADRIRSCSVPEEALAAMLAAEMNVQLPGGSAPAG